MKLNDFEEKVHQKEIEKNYNLMKKNDYKRVALIILICMSLVLLLILSMNFL